MAQKLEDLYQTLFHRQETLQLNLKQDYILTVVRLLQVLHVILLQLKKT